MTFAFLGATVGLKAGGTTRLVADCADVAILALEELSHEVSIQFSEQGAQSLLWLLT